MASDWLGSLVSIDCGTTLGIYQGEVSAVDPRAQTISLRQPFQNGIRCPVPEVSFSASDIKDLTILDIPKVRGTLNKICESKLSSLPAKIGESKLSTSPAEDKGPGPPKAPITILRRGAPLAPRAVSQASIPPVPRRSSSAGASTGRVKDNECFGDATTEGLDADFDFEGNLALFDKAAVYSQMDRNGNSNGSRQRSTPGNPAVPSYRHDENVLEGQPVVYRQITVPQHGGKEFCTDSGLVVPSVSYELYKRLLQACEKQGLSLERRMEITGVCACQMALTLLGGPNRLNPKNVHQRPTVVLLCGPHVQGAQGVSCGRHLANHDVEVILFLPNFVKMQEALTHEISLFGRAWGKQVSSIRDLPTSPVDLVVNCLDSHENPQLREQPWYRAAAQWANQNKAPVLTIDPPVSPQGQAPPAVEAKWSLCLGLPLALGEGAGRVYLCDLGLPRQVFQAVGIHYQSPFGCKFVIPLHAAA
ncbi:enhancer of mRNA-decapping protein 3-like [Engraulis encrasicolus]|uniref:enhancer of mRNA-decapping protein 3-like n=1 Tax=Engraulis encrasicolus TaxID=184585 RepID=UPI002FD30547